MPLRLDGPAAVRDARDGGTDGPPPPLLDRDALARLADGASRQVRAAESAATWRPTPYEEQVLPALRLLGTPRPDVALLQNAADLHLHSEWSDGDLLDRVLDKAVAEELDVIAVTDHDEIEGALEARRRAHDRRLPLAVIPASEVSSADGHIGALFVQRKIPAGLSAADTVTLIHEAGGLAVAHHPFAPRFLERAFGVKLGVRHLIHEVPFDAVECTNAVPGYGRRFNREAQETLRRRRRPVAIVGGSDAHRAALVGKGRTYFAGNRGVVSLRAALETGCTRSAEGYWELGEVFAYRMGLARGVLRRLLGLSKRRR
ncbi:MAG TPA: PHP-associated domain-containing protein [Planctomycetota bacterium]|nr:PHP-associated domain-containing protein [Planctomycetota bacterium]